MNLPEWKFAIVALLISTGCNAQQLYFSTLSIKDGLPSNVVSGIAQDQNDFIWIGTGNGLARYDGYSFRVFNKTAQPNSLPSNEISCLLQTGNTLWVGTWSGLCKIDTRTFEVTRTTALGASAIRTMAAGTNGKIWIGTENGLIQLDSAANIIKTYHTQNSNLSHTTIRSIYEARDGTLWVGTYNKLNRLLPAGGLFETFDLKGSYKPAIQNNLICGGILPVNPLHDSLLWVGTETGLSLFNTVTNQFSLLGDQHLDLSNEVIKCIFPGKDGKLWLGTDFGLNIYDPVTHSVSSYFHNPQIPYSISNNAIWQIFEDRSGVIWLVTSNGLSRLNSLPAIYDFTSVASRIDNQIAGNQVKALMVTTSNILWIGTLHGVIRKDLTSGQTQLFDTQGKNHKLLLNNVYALEEDPLGRIWIGTAAGINIWDDKEQKMMEITATPGNGLVTNYVARMVRTNDGAMWVSTYQGGLFRAIDNLRDPGRIQFKLITDAFGSEKFVAGADAVWYTQYNELFRISIFDNTPKAVREEAIKLTPSMGDIRSLFYSRNSHVWLGCKNGLIEFDPQSKEVRFFPVQTGNDLLITNISEDASGNIWAIANPFLFSVNPTTQHVSLFPIDPNLEIRNFHPGCATVNNQHQILFGGDNGYLQVNTKLPQQTPYESKVFITSLAINNKQIHPGDTVSGQALLSSDITFTKNLNLSYANRSIAFQFTSLHLWQPQLNVYAYKLEGFDEDWIYTSGTKNFAVYTNLEPGNYTFRVKGTNNYGHWSNQEATLLITINPPLLLTWQFLLLYVLIIGAAGWWAIRIYAGRLKLTNELRIARLQKAHAESLSKARQEFFTHISHELRTPISLIMPPIQQLLKNNQLDSTSHKLVHLAEKNSQRLLRVINQTLDFHKLQNNTLDLKIGRINLIAFVQEIHILFSDTALRKKINFHFCADEAELPVWADSEKIETILFNLLSNAFKFTPLGGMVQVTVKQLTEQVPSGAGVACIEITDSGIGLTPEEQKKIFEPFYQTADGRLTGKGSGIGLALALEYVKLHQGTLHVTSAKGKGTTFLIHLPLGKNHLPVSWIHDEEEVEVVATRQPATLPIQKSYRLNLKTDKPLILIIDDNPDIIQFVEESLNHKYNFIAAQNGIEGQRAVQSALPDVVLTDVVMPLMDGIVFCKQLKENPVTSQVAVIFITARAQPAEQAAGIRIGADAYLTKPFEIELLEAHIDHLLERKKELTTYLKQVILTQPPPATANNEDDKFVTKVMSIVEAHIADPEFGVEKLSEEIGMSASYLYRKLKSLTQFSTNDIIRKYRLKKASILLRNKEGNVTEIMYQVGFSNLSYFSKCFKAEYGLNPKDYQIKLSKDSVDLKL
ncbi:MAG: response regulator [Cytophagales bacterium]|nr:response regulator [Cytophagales bacterium]